MGSETLAVGSDEGAVDGDGVGDAMGSGEGAVDGVVQKLMRSETLWDPMREP